MKTASTGSFCVWLRSFGLAGKKEDILSILHALIKRQEYQIQPTDFFCIYQLLRIVVIFLSQSFSNYLAMACLYIFITLTEESRINMQVRKQNCIPLSFKYGAYIKIDTEEQIIRRNNRNEQSLPYSVLIRQRTGRY